MKAVSKKKKKKKRGIVFIYIFGFSGESEAGLDEGVEEGCSSLEPLSQEDCASNYSASSSRRVRNQPESLSLTVGDPFTEAESPENSQKKRKLFRRNVHSFWIVSGRAFRDDRCYSFIVWRLKIQPPFLHFPNFKIVPNDLWSKISLKFIIFSP